MYKALEPVFSHLFSILNAEFKDTTPPANPIFRTFEKGFHLKSEQMETKDLFPWGFVDGLELGALQFARAPGIAQYALNYAIIVMVHSTEADASRLVFNPDWDGNLNDASPGIGDMVEAIGDFLWTDFHRDSNFFGLPEAEDWVVQDWTFEGVRRPRSRSYAYIESSFISIRQIDLQFTIRER